MLDSAIASAIQTIANVVAKPKKKMPMFSIVFTSYSYCLAFAGVEELFDIFRGDAVGYQQINVVCSVAERRCNSF